MFIRRKNNRSGSVSVVVITKQSGKYKEIKTIGVSTDSAEIDVLYQKGKEWIRQESALPDMFDNYEHEKSELEVTERFFNNIESVLLNGTQLILSRVFGLTGFDRIDDELLKHLVIARICQPQSKVATVDYLKSYFDEDVELHRIYRYLDVLQSTQKDKVQEISVEHTRKILGGKIGLVFYDVTTLYFETDYADELRKTGFSKDGKHSQPQIVLGLLVSAGGYPLTYSIHEGNKYEGHTMLPVIEDFVKKFNLQDFVVVADSGLMNSENVELLEKNGYKYIIGARIKNENEDIKRWILSLIKQDGKFYEMNRTTACRLIVGPIRKSSKERQIQSRKGHKTT